MADRNYHDPYTWCVDIVPLDEAQSTLDSITNRSHEVYATHVIQPSGTLLPRLMIIARQHGLVADELATDKIEAAAIAAAENKAPLWEFYKSAPTDGVYSSECEHNKNLRARRGNKLGDCDRCQKAVRWALLEPKQFVTVHG